MEGYCISHVQRACDRQLRQITEFRLEAISGVGRKRAGIRALRCRLARGAGKQPELHRQSESQEIFERFGFHPPEESRRFTLV